MNAVTERFDDALEPLGVAVGVALVLMGLGTVAGAPWATKATLIAGLVQVLGALAMAVLGAGLAYISWTSE